VESQSSKDNMRNQHLLQQLLIKKKNIKWKKLGSIGNMEEEHSTWYTGRAMEIKMTNG